MQGQREMRSYNLVTNQVIKLINDSLYLGDVDAPCCCSHRQRIAVSGGGRGVCGQKPPLCRALGSASSAEPAGRGDRAH